MTSLILSIVTLVQVETQSPLDQFWQNLHQLCGKAYEGRVLEAPPNDTSFTGKRLVMHVRSCTPSEIRIPLHVGEDRSRTWVLTRAAGSIRLKHDHRHEDGSEDKITQYGGDSGGGHSATKIELSADVHTASLIPEAKTNVWTVELHPGRMFVYALRREGTDRRFRLEFDLTTSVTAPPPPWGARETTRPNFSGTWVAVSPESAAGQEEIIKHEGMTLERGHGSESGHGHWFRYTLDGSESKNILTPHPGEEIVTRARASWKDDAIVITEAATYPNGRRREMTATLWLDDQGRLHIQSAAVVDGKPAPGATVVYRKK
jgi:hypothetical protein